jgi:putative transposase
VNVGPSSDLDRQRHLHCVEADMSRKPPPRLRSFDYRGLHRYFLTILTFARAQVFTSHSAVETSLVQLMRTADVEQFSIIAYCFMPDHVHLVVEGTQEASDFQQFVRLFKQRSAFHWKRSTGRILWHRGYHERVLRNHAATIAAIQYVVDNPVRVGLVAQPRDYPYLGSMTRTLDEFLSGEPL